MMLEVLDKFELITKFFKQPKLKVSVLRYLEHSAMVGGRREIWLLLDEVESNK